MKKARICWQCKHPLNRRFHLRAYTLGGATWLCTGGVVVKANPAPIRRKEWK
jgi:hypothetical protein